MMGMTVSSSSGGGGGGDFERPEPGMTLGVLAKYYDLGIQSTTWGGETKQRHKVCFVWELAARDSKGVQFQQYDTLTVSLFGESHMKRRIAALMGRPLEEAEEETGVDLDDLLGKCAMLFLAKSEKGNIFIKDANILQNPNQKLAIEGDYRETPRYVAKILGSSVAPASDMQAYAGASVAQGDAQEPSADDINEAAQMAGHSDADTDDIPF